VLRKLNGLRYVLALWLFLASGYAGATTLRFEVMLGWTNWYDGDLSTSIMCNDQCMQAFEQQTGTMPERFGFLGKQAAGETTLYFMANAETNEILNSQLKIGDWSTDLLGVNFFGPSWAGCVVPSTIQLGLIGGGSLGLCKGSSASSLQSFQALWDAGSLFCSFDSCGILEGDGWRLNVGYTRMTAIHVAEPGTLALLGLGLGGLGLTVRRKAD
jgi:hypothetical protein